MGQWGTVDAKKVAAEKFGLGVTPTTAAAKITDPTGGATTDTQARTAINAIIDVLERFGLSASS